MDADTAMNLETTTMMVEMATRVGLAYALALVAFTALMLLVAG